MEERNIEREQYERLCAYVLGELEGDERTAFEAELEASEALRAEQRVVEATIGLVRSSLGGGQEALSGAAHARLMAEASRSADGGGGRVLPFWKRPGLRLAASVAVLGGAAAVYASLGGEEPRGPAAFRYEIFGDAPADTVASLEKEQAARRQLEGLGYAVDESDAAKAEALRSLGYTDGGSSAAPAAAPEAAAEAPAPEISIGGGAGGPFGTHYASGQGSGKGLGSLTARGGRSRSTNETSTAPLPPGAVAEPGPAAPAEESSVLRLGLADEVREAPDVAARERLEALGYANGSASSPVPIHPGSAATGPGRWFLGQGEEGSAPADGEAPLDADELRDLYVRGYLSAEQLGGLEVPAVDADALRGLGHLGEGEPQGLRRLDSRHLDGRRLADELLAGCRRRPNESPRDLFFRFWGDNPFERTALDALSTFSVDVDTASYTLARRTLAAGHVPRKEQVRTEEFVNYFDPGVPAPAEGTFGIHLELAPSRFSADRERWMLRAVVAGKEVDDLERDPLALTFVIDTSGSMKTDGRLELVKTSLRLLQTKLDANDALALVAFDDEARVVLPMTSAANRDTIELALAQLAPDGSTNAEAGLMLGYALASDQLTPGATNRVVFLSDGVANVGQTDQDRINEEVRRFRERGIYLNTVGVGLSNHNDVFLEQLADKGDGMCDYVDTALEARKAFVDNFTGAFQPIARDVKIQVEFDPAQVERYRLLGYENRAVADRDFRNDAVDAGEVGAGHRVVALYELELGDTRAADGPLATLRLRWKAPHDLVERGGDAVFETASSIDLSGATEGFDVASDGYRKSVLVAQFAELLRRSVHARGDSLDALLAEAAGLERGLRARGAEDPDFSEFVSLLERSRELIARNLPRHDELSLALDAFRRNQVLLAELESLRLEREADLLQRIEQQNQELEERIRELLRQREER